MTPKYTKIRYMTPRTEPFLTQLYNRIELHSDSHDTEYLRGELCGLKLF